MRIFTVLRSGGEYFPVHVQALKRQIDHYLKGAEFICLSDRPIKGVECIPLEHEWPGWWAKMELFREDIRGTILYFDLDTVICGPLDRIVSVRKLTLLRDFYRTGGTRPEGLGSGMMLLPEADRLSPWLQFTINPTETMLRCQHGGDQSFLEGHYMNRADRWQDVVPGGVVSWKVHCKSTVPVGSSVICFHGTPRPWSVPRFKYLYEMQA